MSEFVDVMSKSERQDVDMLIAKFFFGCNIPFSVCQSVHFKNLIKKLRPSYPVSCRNKLSGSFLDQVYDSVFEE